MIDPFRITDFNRRTCDLEAFALFCIVVAGKSAIQQAAKLDSFLLGIRGAQRPFQKVRFTHTREPHDSVEDRLIEVRMGQYKRISRAFIALAHAKLNLRTCTIEDLTAIPGIGPKTARFFLLHSRPNQNLAVLDTHILAALRARGVPQVPRSTPSRAELYNRLETEFLRLAEEAGKSPAELDLELWAQRAKKPLQLVASA